LRDKVIINKSENIEVVINGIVYVPKDLEKAINLKLKENVEKN
jgi:hypothetical protein